MRQLGGVLALIFGLLVFSGSGSVAHAVRGQSDELPFMLISRSSSALSHYTSVTLATAHSPTGTVPARIAVDVPKGYTLRSALPAGSPVGFGIFIQGELEDIESTASLIGWLKTVDAARFASDPAAQAAIRRHTSQSGSSS